MVILKPKYVSVGGNRHPSAADWDPVTRSLAFGCDHNVALWSPLALPEKGVECMLSGHSNEVTALKFLEPSSRTKFLLSGAADNTIRIWNLTSQRLATILHDHASSINHLSTCPGVDIFLSGSADATVKVWKYSISEQSIDVILKQTISLSPRFFPLATALHGIGSAGDVVLAVAGTNKNIQIFVSDRSINFEHQATLSGHEDWIRALCVSKESSSPCSDLILASASQDKYIRLWRLAEREQLQHASLGQESINVLEGSISNKRRRLRGNDSDYLLTFEALLAGHEDWIYTTRWCLNDDGLRLLTSSADNSLAIWEAEKGSGIWVCTTRLGQISVEKGSTTATGSTGGFWIGLWSPNGDVVISLGRSGSWRKWHFDSSSRVWTQGIGISGHVKQVSDIAWAKDGSYLLSTGLDQTTRVHAEWKRREVSSWHEISRAQIHGYNINSIDSIDSSLFISGADEKLLRVFDEPRSSAILLKGLSGAEVEEGKTLPNPATIPVLGLSNKAIESSHEVVDLVSGVSINDGDDDRPRQEFNDSGLQNETPLRPPDEDQLARYTLWPEKEKLYGHGYEIAAVAARPDGELVATSSKASSLDHAVLRLYTSKDWREVKPNLAAHSLTATALAFSPDGRYLLSGGRDRQWVVFEQDPAQDYVYSLRFADSKGHSRMILDVCWAPLAIGRIFATAGRDKLVKLWNIEKDGIILSLSISVPSAATSIDIAPRTSHEGFLLLAVGEESGKFSVKSINVASEAPHNTIRPPESSFVSRSVTRVQWRPMPSDEIAGLDPKPFQLAVSSQDCSVQILELSEDR